MKTQMMLKTVCTGLAIFGVILTFGCGKKEEAAPPTAPGQPSAALQRQLNDPNISAADKEKMKAAANPQGGK